jgi:hypothetical protein
LLNVIDSDIEMTYAVYVYIGGTRYELYDYKKRPTKDIDLSIEYIKTKAPNFSAYQLFDFEVWYTKLGARADERSERFSYQYIKCAPNVNDTSLTPATCSYIEDGSVILTFDRPLFDNSTPTTDDDEKFIYYGVLKSDNSNFPEKKDGETSGYTIKKINATQVQITGLPHNTYTFYYQTQVMIGGKAYLTDKTSTPSFTIAPDPLTFAITPPDNPKCFNNPGAITITASGGTPPYFYDDLENAKETINGVEVTKRIQFAVTNNNATSVTIPNLDPKIYTIKVTDNSNCIEK